MIRPAHPWTGVRTVRPDIESARIEPRAHPIGVAEPSQADEIITTRLRDALALIDVRVLDHLIVAGSSVTSLAERGVL